MADDADSVDDGYQLSGKTTASGHCLRLRVYYEDTDFSGLVYHANYLKFCERGRSDWLRLLGVHHHELSGHSFFAVRRMLCDFIKPARIDDVLEVRSHFVEATGARLHLAQEVCKAAAPLFKAEVTVVIIDERGRPLRIPSWMTARFSG